MYHAYKAGYVQPCGGHAYPIPSDIFYRLDLLEPDRTGVNAWSLIISREVTDGKGGSTRCFHELHESSDGVSDLDDSLQCRVRCREV